MFIFPVVLFIPAWFPINILLSPSLFDPATHPINILPSDSSPENPAPLPMNVL
jgi:hypothetical protein